MGKSRFQSVRLDRLWFYIDLIQHRNEDETYSVRDDTSNEDELYSVRNLADLAVCLFDTTHY